MSFDAGTGTARPVLGTQSGPVVCMICRSFLVINSSRSYYGHARGECRRVFLHHTGLPASVFGVWLLDYGPWG
jgi:hypothetical protein